MITFRRDDFILRVRRKHDTERTVVEIGTPRGLERVGHLKTDRAPDFVKYLTALIGDAVTVVVDDE